MNKCLTVNPNQPGSHKNIWSGFNYRIVEAIIIKNPKTIFVMWGREAQKFNKLIRGRCPTIETSHPSAMNKNGGFLGSKCFSKINELLKQQGQNEIDWNLRLVSNFNIYISKYKY